MSKIVVVLTVHASDGRAGGTDEIDGATWSVDAGVLSIYDGSGDIVASYPDGRWWRVLRQA